MRRSIILSRGSTRQRIGIGFSWGAFLFGALWAIYRRLWLVFTVLVIITIPIWFLDGVAEARRSRELSYLGLILSISYMVVCGAFGNRLRRWTLERHGYAVVEEPGNES
jgi:hypothetical protein